MNKYMKIMLAVAICLLVGFLPQVVYAEDTKTNYHLPFEEAVDIQFEADAIPITSEHGYDPVYVPLAKTQIVLASAPLGGYVQVYEEPKREEHLSQLLVNHGAFSLLQVVEGEEFRGSTVWYELWHGGEKYYLHESFAPFVSVKMKDEVAVRDLPNKDGHVYGYMEKGSKHIVQDIEGDYLALPFDMFRFAKRSDVAYYMDPEHGNGLQHLRLDELAEVSADEVNDVLVGKGILEGEGEAFVEGAHDANINEAYLLAHAFLETGHGESPLATGIDVGVNEEDEAVVVTDENREDVKDVETVYNMFGIEAVDSCPVECGAVKAYEAGWTSPAIAIRDGAEWIGKGYIYNEFEQNTLYKMRWNPEMKDGSIWKQYATDVGWAGKQTSLLEDIISQWDDPDLTFDYPVFE